MIQTKTVQFLKFSVVYAEILKIYFWYFCQFMTFSVWEAFALCISLQMNQKMKALKYFQHFFYYY